MDHSPNSKDSASNKFDDRLSRYVQRIQKLMNRDRSRSPSPYNPKSRSKVLTKGPMINRLDTYIRYEHCFHVLMKLMSNRDQYLVKIFFAELKHFQGQKKQQKIYRFVPVRVIQQEQQAERPSDDRGLKINLLMIILTNLKRKWLRIGMNNIKSQPRRARTTNRKNTLGPGLLLLASFVNRKILSFQRLFWRGRQKTKVLKHQPNISIIYKIKEVALIKLMVAFRKIVVHSQLKQVQQSYLNSLANQVEQTNKQQILTGFDRLTKGVRILKKVLKNKHLLEGAFQKIKNYCSFSLQRIKYLWCILERQQKMSEIWKKWALSQIRHFSKYKHGAVLHLMLIMKRQQHKMLIESFIRLAKPTQITRKPTLSDYYNFTQKFSIFIDICQNKVRQTMKPCFTQLIRNHHKLELFNIISRKVNKVQKLSIKLIKEVSRKTIDTTALKYLAKIIQSTIQNNIRSAFFKLHKIEKPKAKVKMDVRPQRVCSMARCLRRLFVKRVLFAYSKIRMRQDEEYENTTDASNIVNEVLEFISERNQNFSKIQENYKKLKAMASYQEDQPEQSYVFSDTKSLIMSLKTKILNS